MIYVYTYTHTYIYIYEEETNADSVNETDNSANKTRQLTKLD